MTSAPDILVRFENVQKSYDGESLVVKDFNLDMERGEFLTMLGPSGSGKTTCLMMLAGFEPATSGEIYLSGQPINRVPPHKRGIGMVFQNYALFPHMTVGENLAFPLEVRGMAKSEREAKVEKALDMVQLGQFANRRPGQLSGGQAQRVAVARALVFDPEVVLMDEPLGALDKNLREQMQYEIKHIHENLQVTILYVTHDQSEALTMSNRVAVFDDGVVQQLAPPDELYEQPDNAFVADFIGDNNRILATVISANGETCQVKTDDGSEITAKQVNIAGEGKRTTLSLRPERIEVGPEPGKYENNVDAKALELIYLGDHIRTRMQACGRDDFVVKIPNSSAHAQLVEGDTVTVGWTAEDCRALDPTD
ncbi:MAG: ABC transporter ATP-binding protein [Gammaproteobacteria bacterium]|nr:ABC transporter ATP-binding protein [Gammaproteobacteria bacterium]